MPHPQLLAREPSPPTSPSLACPLTSRSRRAFSASHSGRWATIRAAAAVSGGGGGASGRSDNTRASSETPASLPEASRVPLPGLSEGATEPVRSELERVAADTTSASAAAMNSDPLRPIARAIAEISPTVAGGVPRRRMIETRFCDMPAFSPTSACLAPVSRTASASSDWVRRSTGLSCFARAMAPQ